MERIYWWSGERSRLFAAVRGCSGLIALDDNPRVSTSRGLSPRDYPYAVFHKKGFAHKLAAQRTRGG